MVETHDSNVAYGRSIVIFDRDARQIGKNIKKIEFFPLCDLTPEPYSEEEKK
ncbi:hypothetical protein LEP1GSC193_3074 [Leptospira alstonii serovar Pingchang str. 80-412]|uniref:Uncharacterized protein n=2 Tax=Leptospira alstonii TaxID=28452 RepID=M6CZG7_9LEPT|nr:hypothetical protein LEP1GSC194_4067 [Leptospira alstonii serovar Sichuan str. 79601]EQA79636.1 hypothetical protein LEP1GSC193_3074 [Leptospira alstonii serovar Pingchang str. 80-412]